MKLSKPLNKYFDHTLLKPEAVCEQIDKLCDEAKQYDFYSVCVNTCYVARCADNLRGSDVKVAAVVGFPLGACTTATKAFETEEACKDGAGEIDMVLNVGAFKDGRYDYVRDDIYAVVEAAAKYNAIVKVILENYGYDIMDLGRDVNPEYVAEMVQKHDVKLVGLSALMTTTVKNMAITIEKIKDKKQDCKVFVGGAVLNEEYAKMINADFYARDAKESVKIAESVLRKH